jgi:methyltransferase (TIGR00027 family)
LQEPKAEILHKRKLPLPPELVFVPIDFDREDIFEVLTKAGIQEGRKNLFLWEGVSMDLSAEAVDGTLAFIHEHSALRSQLVFDYLYASVLRRENRFYGEREIYKTGSRTGEGWTFGLEEGEVEPFLAGRGFKVIAHYTPPDQERKYLTTEDGAHLGPVNGTHCIVVAEIAKGN